ncbi:hypothetical protein BS50DRAFT_616305 [Corynespora cassiicola Philippines]|uniref:GPI anchored protein n=1 Tax=Corynespora cassiicola Philippines TaxID=1448308 RepID=A0A2T2P550_CORCC|nr:hypothetical protein BS50DRAFT_616305 [Corynespora cassiicola Philippines]
MRHAFPALLLLVVAPTALAAPDLVTDFIAPTLPTSPAGTQNNETYPEVLELLRGRQVDPNECAQGYSDCGGIGAPGLCCRTNQVCSADAAGNVACCPSRAACTGTIGNVGGGAATQQPTQTVPGGATTTSSTVPFVVATSTGEGNPFVQQSSGGGATTRSTVPNEFYPFAFIPTTYTNAAACSSAYSTCQTDAASCTAALASGRQGVAVSAPNGGATITAIPSLGPASASLVCSSLSSQACYGLQVEACARFGDAGGSGAGGRRHCGGNAYKVGAGVAVVGIVGQMLR